MRYESLEEISREDAEAVMASHDAGQMSIVLLRLALHDPDWRYVQERCLQNADHPDVWVRRNCATALSHLARLHGRLDLGKVWPALEVLRRDRDVAPWVESAADDIRTFVGADAPWLL